MQAPTDHIRDFCRAWTTRVATVDEMAPTLKATSATRSEALQALREAVAEAGGNVAVDADTAAQLVTSSRTGRALNEERVTGALQGVPEVAFTTMDAQSLANVVYKELQKARSTTSEKLVFRKRSTRSIAGGAEVSGAYARYQEASDALTQLRKERTDRVKECGQTISRCSGAIQSWMDRVKERSLELNLEGGSDGRFFLRSVVQRQKRSPNAAELRSLVVRAIQALRQSNTLTRDTAAAEIWSRIAAIPPSEKRAVRLVRAPARRAP